MANKLTLPDFASESEEAQWWFKNRDTADYADIDGRSVRAVLAEHDLILPQDNITAVLSPEVLAQVDEQARRKGLDRNRYIESLVTDGLRADRAA